MLTRYLRIVYVFKIICVLYKTSAHVGELHCGDNKRCRIGEGKSLRAGRGLLDCIVVTVRCSPSFDAASRLSFRGAPDLRTPHQRRVQESTASTSISATINCERYTRRRYRN